MDIDTHIDNLRLLQNIVISDYNKKKKIIYIYEEYLFSINNESINKYFIEQIQIKLSSIFNIDIKFFKHIYINKIISDEFNNYITQDLYDYNYEVLYNHFCGYDGDYESNINFYNKTLIYYNFIKSLYNEKTYSVYLEEREILDGINNNMVANVKQQIISNTPNNSGYLLTEHFKDLNNFINFDNFIKLKECINFNYSSAEDKGEDELKKIKYMNISVNDFYSIIIYLTHLMIKQQEKYSAFVYNKQNSNFEKKDNNGLFNLYVKKNTYAKINNYNCFLQKVTIPSQAKTLFIGDFHSSFYSLFVILENNRDMFMDSTMYLKKNCYIFFLGDIIDRGPHSMELLACVCLLKIYNMDNVYIIKGNHEDNTAYKKKGFLGQEIPYQQEYDDTTITTSKKPQVDYIVDTLFTFLPDCIYLHNGKIYRGKKQWIHLSHGAFNPMLSGTDDLSNFLNSDIDLFCVYNSSLRYNSQNKEEQINKLRIYESKIKKFDKEGDKYMNFFRWGDFYNSFKKSLIPGENLYTAGKKNRPMIGYEDVKEYLEKNNILCILSGHQDFFNLSLFVNPQKQQNPINYNTHYFNNYYRQQYKIILSIIDNEKILQLFGINLEKYKEMFKKEEDDTEKLSSLYDKVREEHGKGNYTKENVKKYKKQLDIINKQILLKNISKIKLKEIKEIMSIIYGKFNIDTNEIKKITDKEECKGQIIKIFLEKLNEKNNNIFKIEDNEIKYKESIDENYIIEFKINEFIKNLYIFFTENFYDLFTLDTDDVDNDEIKQFSLLSNNELIFQALTTSTAKIARNMCCDCWIVMKNNYV
jgi:hypothetical protein